MLKTLDAFSFEAQPDLDKTGADLLFGFISQLLRAAEPGGDDEPAVRALVRGLPRSLRRRKSMRQL